MDIGLVVLRLLHITFGVYWAGAIFFTVLYLQPAVAEAGPDGGKVMQGIQRRGFMKVTPLLALITILAGLELLRRVSAGFDPAWFGSRTGIVYSTGMVAAIVALTLGFFVMRVAMLKAAELAGQAQQAPEAERGAMATEIARYRTRAATTARLVAVLLLVTVVTMAVGRYV